MIKISENKMWSNLILVEYKKSYRKITVDPLNNCAILWSNFSLFAMAASTQPPSTDIELIQTIWARSKPKWYEIGAFLMKT